MVILVAGAGGFLGRALADALAARGHVIVGTVRDLAAARPSAAVSRWIRADYMQDHSPADWEGRLHGIDLAINAVGIFRESRGATFEAVHIRAPCALFDAGAKAGVRIVQLSALGADDGAQTDYHISKRTADEYLLRIDADAVVVQPSLVYGTGGTSAALFNMLASLPLIPLPGKGAQQVQPIHIEDFTAAAIEIVEHGRCGRRVALVGREPVTLRRYLAALRGAMGLGKPVFVPIPWPAVRFGVSVAAVLPGSLLTMDTLKMLQRGNVADVSATRRLLGREPRRVDEFIRPTGAGATLREARLSWLLPVMRVAIAGVWIVSGIVSLGPYPSERSYQMLARTGIAGTFAPIALYGAAALDIAFGILSLALRRRRWLWAAQAVVIVAYTCVITIALPEYWLHPFGPIVKNLPILAALWMLYELETQ